MNTVMVLGAAGFIGRHLCRELAGKKIKVLAATRKPAEFNHSLADNIVSPFSEPDHFLAALKHADAFIHAASDTTPGGSNANPLAESNHIRSNLALIEALQSYPGLPVLYISSGGTLYGSLDKPVPESMPVHPRSYHGAAKASVELFLGAWAQQYEGSLTILRPSNVYGPGQHAHKGFGIIPAAMESILEKTPLTVWDTDTVRDYLYIEDLCRLCLEIIASENEPGVRIFNASAGKGTRLGDLLEMIGKVAGTPVEKVVRPRRRLDITQIVPDNQKAIDTFDWRPAMELPEGLKQTWAWFKRQNEQA